MICEPVFENSLIRERTIAGIAGAKTRGKSPGRRRHRYAMQGNPGVLNAGVSVLDSTQRDKAVGLEVLAMRSLPETMTTTFVHIDVHPTLTTRSPWCF